MIWRRYKTVVNPCFIISSENTILRITGLSNPRKRICLLKNLKDLEEVGRRGIDFRIVQ